MNRANNSERTDIESLLSKEEIYRIKKKTHYENNSENSADSNGFPNEKAQQSPENSVEIIGVKERKSAKNEKNEKN